MTKRPSKKSAAAAHTSRRSNGSIWAALFTHFAVTIAHWSGKPLTFSIAVILVLIWAASGPVFGFSDTWQLVINTSTTIITFLMVFLIQNTQNRDTLALQIKLAELLHAVRGAKTQLATVEELSDEELEQLHAEYHELAASALNRLESRRSGRPKR
jgi:low affinity Fe/Cu permease